MIDMDRTERVDRTMKTISDYLAEYAVATGCGSDYALAKKLSISKQAISKYRHGTNAPGVDTCWRIADTLGIDPAAVIAAAQVESAKCTHDTARLAVWRARLSSLSAHGEKIFSVLAALPAVYLATLECILCQIPGPVLRPPDITVPRLRRRSNLAQSSGFFRSYVYI